MFAVFGRKPRRMQDGADGGRYCSGLVVYHQWLALVRVWPGIEEVRKVIRKGSARGNISLHLACSQVKLDPPTAETGGTGTTAKDPWILQTPLPLLPSPTARSYPASAKYVMEKNWMPFTHRVRCGNQNMHLSAHCRLHGTI